VDWDEEDDEDCCSYIGTKKLTRSTIRTRRRRIRILGTRTMMRTSTATTTRNKEEYWQ
jgi:hypothetical protein